MSEREFAGVQPAEEDLMVTGVDCDLELADLLRLRSDEHISTLGVRGLGAERAATKQPHRMTGQHGAISHHKLRRLLQPMGHLDSTSNDEGIVVFKVVDLADFLGVRLRSLLPQLLGDELRYALRGPILACVDYDSFHDLSPPALTDSSNS